MNYTSPPESSHPTGASEPESPDTPQAAPSDERAKNHSATSYEELDREMATPNQTPEEKKEIPPPPAPRPPAMPPPLPTFGAPQSPPRFAAPPQRPPGSSPQPVAQPPAEQPPYPPRIAAPQPAPPGGMAEPPRPYEGGRYVPPPPIPSSGPTVPGRDWSPANTTITPQPQPAPQHVASRGNGLATPLLGIIAALLLALAVFQGINTFHPKAASPTGVQQVQVQKIALKPTTAAEVKDTVTNAQTALNQFNQKVQDAYAGATTDAQRQAILLQAMISLQQIIAQQNNDLLLIYQDLNP